MGRTSTVEDEVVFDAVGSLLAARGSVTLQSIVTLTGVSIGSLYHRYGSREGLLASAWLDAVTAFQAQFLAALRSGGADAGEQAALATPRFCRSERSRAIILACCRQSEFLFDDTPQDLRDKIAEVNKAAAEAVQRFAKSSGYSLEACRMALVAFPMGAVRVYLPSRPVPASADAYVSAAYRAAISAK
jgi:AcrR family transcriptional regulator